MHENRFIQPIQLEPRMSGPIVVLVRHGESEGNISNVVQGGDLDSPLTDLGKRQAESCGKFLQLRFKKFDRIICSTLKRSIETAKILCQMYGIDLEMMEVDDNLCERRYGPLVTGQTWKQNYRHPQIGKEIKRLRKRVKATNVFELIDGERDRRRDELMSLVGGETNDLFSNRVRKVHQKIDSHLDSESSGNLLVVGHSGSITEILRMVTGHPVVPEQYGRWKNCNVSIIRNHHGAKQLILSRYSKYLDEILEKEEKKSRKKRDSSKK